MKLTNVEVSNYQSIRQSNPFNIGDITCLVGKNEAGKTAILQALYRLNPVVPEQGKFDVTDDYPRADVENYLQDIEAGRKTPATVVRATFTLDKKEITDIEAEFGNGVLDSNELVLSKGYDNLLNLQLAVNESKAVAHIIEVAKLPTPLPDELGKATTIQDISSIVPATTDPKTLEQVNRLKAQVQPITQAKGLVSYIRDKYIQKFIPKFLYFDEFFLMKGQENVDALKQRIASNKLDDSDRPLLGLVELARLKLDQLVAPPSTQWLINKLEGASNHLSGKILKYWSQNRHLYMRFDVRPAQKGDPPGMTTGNNIWALVNDSKRMVSTRLGTRSRGFVWFFSFLAWFDQEQRKNQSLILLMDEPGLFLHGKAQSDLLNFLEKELKPNHQVVYTTHSPFMVDSGKFERVRIVQDKSMDTDEILPPEDDGTKVITEVLEATEDSLFPLQGALGCDICQSLFVGPNSLVVEGVSDLLYLHSVSAVLQSQGKESLSDKWTITPVGGADKVPTFVALLGAQHSLNIATLIDLQKKDHQTIDNLYKKKLLKKQNVLTFADFTGTPEADIEDFFEVSFYLNLVNAEYAANLTTPVTPTMLTSKSPRTVSKLESYFAANPMKNNAQFNHYRPARYFSENASTLVKQLSADTLSLFEETFKKLNTLLKK
jgi:predicted ATP-dependent endonuclease of OLD family